MQYFDIIIVGAGPAGTTAALALKDSKLRVLLIDQSNFPREKTCGGDINGYVPLLLKRLLPESSSVWEEFTARQPTKTFRLVSPNFNVFKTSFHLHGACATRKDFDYYLLQLVQRHSTTQFLPNCTLQALSYTSSGVCLSTTQGNFEAKAIIGADGVHSVVKSSLTTSSLNPQHYCTAVRGYFTAIKDVDADTLEIFFPKDYLPSHFWISAHAENEYTVGFGMLRSTIEEKSIDLKKAFWEIIQQHPELSVRFQEAVQVGELVAGDLPLASKLGMLSGKRFVLVGDAASLINPLTGEGIGNGMFSAEIAVKQLIEAFKQDDFSAEFMQGYDQKIEKKFGKTMKISYRIQRMLYNRTYLINFFIRLMGRNTLFRKISTRFL